MCLYFFSKNSRVLSEWEQWTYCKSLSVDNSTIWAKIIIMFSRKPDHKLLPLFACCYAQYKSLTMPNALHYFFKKFTPDEKQNIAVIRSYINTFYLVFIKYLEIFGTIHPMYVIQLIENLPEIKPK